MLGLRPAKLPREYHCSLVARIHGICALPDGPYAIGTAGDRLRLGDDQIARLAPKACAWAISHKEILQWPPSYCDTG